MGTLPGAASYISATNTRTCKRCNEPQLAWAQTKTGRWYLCNTQPSQSERADMVDARVALPWSPHRCPTNAPPSTP